MRSTATLLVIVSFLSFSHAQSRNCENNKSPCVCRVDNANNCPEGVVLYSDSYPFNFQYNFECAGQVFCSYGEELCAQCQKVDSDDRLLEVVFENTQECNRAQRDYEDGKIMNFNFAQVRVGTQSSESIPLCSNFGALPSGSPISHTVMAIVVAASTVILFMV